MFLFILMERWSDGAMERWSDGAMERWSDGAMERWSDGAMEPSFQLSLSLSGSWAALTKEGRGERGARKGGIEMIMVIVMVDCVWAVLVMFLWCCECYDY